MKHYEEQYNRISDWFLKSPKRVTFLKAVYRLLPFMIALLYAVLIFRCVYPVCNWKITAKVLLVPLSIFVLITFVRRRVNAPRPYTKYAIRPLILKEKPGESFPSRHTLSAAVIAMAWLYTDIRLGIVMWLLTAFLAMTRVVAGVHFVTDVLAAVVISVVWGYVGFWLL